MPVADKPQLELGAVKVQLKNAEFFSEFPPHRYPEGAVLSVSTQTAQHWYDRGIAVPAEVGAKTHIEARRAELEAQLAALDAEAGPVGKYNAAMTLPPPTEGGEGPRRRGRRSTLTDPAIGNRPESDEDEE